MRFSLKLTQTKMSRVRVERLVSSIYTLGTLILCSSPIVKIGLSPEGVGKSSGKAAR